MNKYLGCSGFYYWHWRGRFYPEGLPASEWLKYYAKHFNAIEINSSFYRWPRESTLKRWIRETPEGFRIVMKANREITHLKRFRNVEGELKRLYKLADVLRNKLAGILFQLPPSIHKDIEFLRNMLSQLDPSYKNIIEFRHKSWFCKRIYKLMENKHVCFCSVSAPKRLGIPEEVIKTTSEIYIRFHGVERWYRYDYSEEELALWAKKIMDAKPKAVYAFFNNDFDANAPANCLKLKELLERC